jgi:proteasome lid subunit RPN8/RPN11
MRIRQSAIDDMVSHAHAESPNECCGLLIGSAEEIAAIERARNLQSSRARFLIDPEDHLAAIRHARAAGLAVMGAYHSHPHSAARPSATDRAEISYPEFLQVIVSLADDQREPDVRAYRLEEGNFQPVELVVLR